MSEEDQGFVEESQEVPEVSQSEAPQQEAPQAEQQADYWSHFKSLPDFQGKEDRDIAAHLYQTMERERAASQALAQYQQVLPYAQDYMANRKEFDAWRNSQRQSQQQTAQATEEVKKFWAPPEVKDSYRRYLVKDENGRDAISEDAPLDARQALIEHMNYRADFAQKFLDNPEQTLGPMIQQMAQEQAQQIVQSTFETRENEAFVEQIEKENADWLIDSQTGQVTPEGFLVHKYIEEAREQGINGPRPRWNYARAMTERDLLARRFEEEDANAQALAQGFMQQQQPPPMPEQPVQAPPQKDTANQNMEYLRREASRNPSRSAGRGIENGQKPRQNLSFEQMLQEDLSNKGYI